MTVLECHIKGAAYYPRLMRGNPILLQTRRYVKLPAYARLDTVLARQYHRITGSSPEGPSFFPFDRWKSTAPLGISPVVGRLTLDQEAEVRTLHPQPSQPRFSSLKLTGHV